MVKDKVLAIVPTLNEEELLDGVLIPLITARDQGVVDEILVIDAFSTDRTVAIAQKLGVTVIDNIPGGAKTSAIKKLLMSDDYQDFNIFFITDADMFNLTHDKVAQFLGHIVDKEDVAMIRSQYTQISAGEYARDGPREICPLYTSGFRAIRRSALDGLVEAIHAEQQGIEPHSAVAKKWAEYIQIDGLSFDYSTEMIIQNGKIPVEGLNLESRGAGEGAQSFGSIVHDLHEVEVVHDHRDLAANAARMLRRLKDNNPNDPQVSGKSMQQLVSEAKALPPVEVEKIRAKLDRLRVKPGYNKQRN